MRLGDHKMFLCLVLVDQVVHFANSVSVQHVATFGRKTLWKNSSFVFMHTAFSMQIAGSVLWRTIARDRV